MEIIGRGGKGSGRYISPNLTETILRNANLTHVDLDHLDLTTTDLEGAKLDKFI